MINNAWIDFKKAYAKTFNVDEHLVDLIAVWDIVLFCASGRSSKTIARFLSMDLDYIQDVLYEFLGFTGFEYDLDLNPSPIFDRSEDFDSFMEEVHTVSPVTLDIESIKWYNICIKFSLIREELDKYYGTN